MTSNSYSFFKTLLPAIFLVFLVGALVYSNTLQVPFVFDDERSITQNDLITNLDNFYINNSGYEFVPGRYLAYLSFALNHYFGGFQVSGYHAVNLLIHLLSALMVFVLLRLTFQTPYLQNQSETDSGNKAGSTSTWFTPGFFVPLFAALLFVVHPVQTQAVTYVVQRMTSLATFFYLFSLVLYVLARLAVGQSGNRDLTGSTGKLLKPLLMIAGAVIVAVMAMKTKEIAFTLPFTVLLYEGFFFRGSWKKRLLFLLPLLATLPIIPLTVLNIGGPAGDILADSGEQLRVQSGMSRLDYLLTQFRVIVTYLRLLVFPVNQNLDYDYPVYTTFFSPPVFLSFLLLTAIVVLASLLFWRTRACSISQVEIEGGVVSGLARNSIMLNAQAQPASSCPNLRLISFGILWFFLTISVESSLIPIVDVIMEHRLYLPSFGAATVFAVAFYLLSVKFSGLLKRKLMFTGAFLLILLLGFATYQRNHVWGDSLRLWQDVSRKSPNKGRPNNNLAVALEDVGRRKEAIETLNRTIAVDPGYYKSYYNLADLYLVSNQPEKSLPLLQSAIRLKPDFVEAYVEIGAALMRSGRFQEVVTFLKRYRHLVGENAEAHFYLGASYAFQGNRKAALRELAIVSRLDPELAADLKGLLR
jgi:hypothetical protein